MSILAVVLVAKTSNIITMGVVIVMVVVRAAMVVVIVAKALVMVIIKEEAVPATMSWTCATMVLSTARYFPRMRVNM